MDKSYLITQCSVFKKLDGDSSSEFGLLAGNPNISYYESLFSPSVNVTIETTDVSGFVSREEIYGGQSIEISIKMFDPDIDDFKIKKDKHGLVVNSVKNVTMDFKESKSTLECVSKDFLKNEVARLNRRFTGNITEIVKKIMEEEPKGIETTKDIEVDQATNSYTFCGNLKRSIDTIQWLQPKAKSENQFGFLFFEDYDGYKFKSIESLLKQEPFTDQPFEMSQASTSSRFAILDAVMVQTNDVFLNMRSGTYNNDTTYIDLISQTKSVDDFKIDNLKDLKNPPKLPDNLTDNTSRKMLRFDDPGVMQKGSKREDEQPKEELAKIQNQSYARNNLLFSQALKIKVSFNPSLRVGKIIEVRLPVDTDSSESGVKYQKLGKGDLSGKYLISELRHKVGSNKSSTHLTLVRDLFTKDNA
tara:strand:+ start:298 stop:1545 length:1248 start_codon:yes stop_codon:yes gene_type:complete